MLRLALTLGAVAVALAALFAGAKRILNRPKRVADARITSPEEHTVMDDAGAVRSVQAADLTLPVEALEELWVPESLERLARTYWRFLTRVTLGLIRVRYRDDGRDVTLLGLIPLLSFQAPEYEMDAGRGIVRWGIEKGVLVQRTHQHGDGFLEIDVRRCPTDDPATARVHVEVEVANFYPAIATGIGRWVYENTQSRIHVIVTHGFLRSLARLDLAESRVGRFARVEDVPDPQPRDRDAAAA
jgi:hypothetical protein